MAFHFEAKSVAHRAEVAMVQLRSFLGLQPVDSEYNPVLLNTHHTPKKTNKKTIMQASHVHQDSFSTTGCFTVH